MICLISKNNSWSQKLFERLSQDNLKIYWLDSQSYWMDINDFNHKIDWVFFFHWSELIPKSIYEKYKCVSIHTSNLPQGRGGHPLQNQIINNIVHTHVNAIETTEPIDSGKIYKSIPITLQGTLSDIWEVISDSSYFLIKEIINGNYQLKEQTEEPTKYKRRPTNTLPSGLSLKQLYDFIRMLDAEGYPRAYIEMDNFRFEFNRAKKEKNEILADVKIKYIGASCSS